MQQKHLPASSSIFDSHARRDAQLPLQNEFKCLVDAPGLNKEDLGIEVDGDVLRVRCAHHRLSFFLRITAELTPTTPTACSARRRAA